MRTHAASCARDHEYSRLVRFADPSRERPAWWALAAAALASFVLHIPFLTTPLSVDEGGYGYVARWWAAGAHLYGDVWVDRPQGLLLLYRGALALPGGNAFDIRLMATLWSCAIAVVLGLFMTRMAGRRAGIAAALLSGLLSTAPVIEGFTANGELMATLPALAALALTARWQMRGGLRVMFLAGLFAGAAFLVKQSGYDGGLAAGIWLVLAAWRQWLPRRVAPHHGRDGGGAHAARRLGRTRDHLCAEGPGPMSAFPTIADAARDIATKKVSLLMTLPWEESPTGLLYAFGSLWVSNFDRDTVWRVDVSS